MSQVAYGFAKAAGGTIAAAASIAMGIRRLMHAASIWHHVYVALIHVVAGKPGNSEDGICCASTSCY